MKTVTFLDNLHHRIGGLAGNDSCHYRVMQIRIKWPAEGLDGSNCMALKHIKKHLPYEANSLGQRSVIPRLLGSSDGPFQAIQDEQQIEDDGSMLEAAFLLALAPDPLLVVLEVGSCPLEQVPELIALARSHPQLFQIFQYFCAGLFGPIRLKHALGR